MRKSHIRTKLQEQKPVLLTKINTQDPVVVDMIGLFGFDGVWICNEHAPIDADRLAHLIRTAGQNNLDTIVRVQRASYNSYIHPLELGASGIMVPHCKSASEVAGVVKDTRFHPTGRRPLDSGNADGNYCMVPLLDYMQHANANTCLVVQIEDPEAVEQVEDIAAIDGVDALFVGPGDLSQALGVPGQMEHPEILKAIERVALACKKHGRAWGLPINNTTAQKFLEMGATFCATGSDVHGLQNYYRNIQSEFGRFGFDFSPRI